ncbi:EAL domain-containing protein [Dokdonella sp.]|uniref:EAL domain-containing protein n=1 Tax=Dokdonella sp. TaxID=2291710 RepID=UPI003C371AAC
MQARELTSRRPRSRAAFVNQIPARAGDLRLRGEQLRQGYWDINAALLLAEDAEALASNCHLLDRAAVANRLEEFAECLWTLLDPPRMPDSQALDEIGRQLEALAEGDDSPILDTTAGNDEPATLFGYAAAEANGFPLLVRPPKDYWRRFASSPIASAPSVPETLAQPAHVPTIHTDKPVEPTADIRPAIEPVPVVAPVPEAATPVALRPTARDPEPELDAEIEVETDPAPRKVFHLADGADLSKAIDLQLRAQGNEIESLGTVDALKEAMHRATPSLVLLEGTFQEAIEEIGALVRAARSRSRKRVLLVALSEEKTDLAARLRAMRAGCDAFIVQPGNADDVMGRLRELNAAEHADPFRIMIVEDDRSQALFAESILRKNGMQTLAVNDASVVLDKLDEFRPDLILMDLNMPVCDGMELTALIREREAYISTPIVFLSGEGDTEKHFEALSAGGDDFLSKPIAPRHLISAVTSRVRRARQLERRRRAPSAREASKGVHDSAQLARRLTEMLSMEDAATRKGGLMYLELADAEACEDRVGHSAFRILLDRLTMLLAAHIGNGDMLARCGEHGFLLLNPDLTTQALEDHAKALRACVAVESFGTTKVPQELKIQVGICPFSVAAGDAKAMIDAAENALRTVPAGDTAGIALVAPVASEEQAGVLVAAIRKALDDSSFRVVFQPIVSLHGEEEEQFQALLRLSNDDGRVYAAAELVPAAEEAGLISDVDRWMFDSCLGTIADHLRDGRNLRLFLSLSASSVLDPDRVEWIRNALDTHRVPAALISIEIRLADAAGSLSAYIRFAMAMKQLGVSLTLSGLEAGMLGTEMLLNLPVDFIKLSPRYTADPDDSLRSELRELVKLAHAGGRRVIAPRVEEARVAASLWASGIDLIQGNFVRQATRDTSYDFQMAGN